MKELWLELPEKLSRDEASKLLKASGGACSTILIPDGIEERASLARKEGIKVAAKRGGDIDLLESADEGEINRAKSSGRPLCVKIIVAKGEDEAKVSGAADLGVDYVLISCPDWKIIPLENIIAKVHGRAKILAEASSASEARVALETLELGVDGVVLKTSRAEEVEATAKLLKAPHGAVEKGAAKISLIPAKVVAVKELGLAFRVCVDTCDLMANGEGMLVGCQSSGLFLMEAEVYENPHVEPRPFRVNAGPVSLYILTPANKTKYLSELKAGDEVWVVDREGNTRTALVGRVKIERRPMVLIEAEVGGSRIKTISQNAETIRLVTKDGSKAVPQLKPGDEVLVYYQAGGRHFGILVKEETVIER